MNWFVHDNSLNGQFATEAEFLAYLRRLLQLRAKLPIINERLRCSREIGGQLVTPLRNFREVLMSCSDQVLRRLALNWIDSKGPFLDEDAQEVDENYFEYVGNDVTNRGAGEAARRVLNGLNACIYSFSGGGSDYSPLRIDHGLAEERLGQLEIENIWHLTLLEAAALQAIPSPNNWEQSLGYAAMVFQNLSFSENLIDFLRRETFTIQLVENIFSKLAKLNEFVASRNSDGTNSVLTEKIIGDHFSGEKAWFTDESNSNKTEFKEKLSFLDPDNPGSKIFCPFHGKIKTPQYRIHFPWPLEKNDKYLRIVYIGPKLTKK